MKSQKSIAVLPFINRSSNEELEYFSDGLSEEIINALSKVSELSVTSRSSSFSFKESKLTLSEIGNQLNVAIILEGSVRLSGNSVRITAQLAAVESDYYFWSDTFDRELKNVFVIQDEISIIIADRLREHLGHFELKDQLVDLYDVPLDVYKLYLKGRYHLMKLDHDHTQVAISIFKTVIANVPDFPLPYLDINQGYTYMGTMGIINAYEGFSLAQPYLEKGIALGSELPETHLNLAWINCWQKWDLVSAYAHLNQALAIKQTDEMYITMANLLTIEGRLDLALKYTNKALEVAPFSSVNLHYKGFIFYLKGHYEEAIPFFKQSMALQPDLPFPIVYLGFSYIFSNRSDEGMNFFSDLPEDSTGYLSKIGGTTLAHILGGNFDLARDGIQLLESFLNSASAGNALNFLILCHAQLDNLDVAMMYFNRAVKDHFPLVLLLPTEPLAQPLKYRPEFLDTISDILGNVNINEPTQRYKKTLFQEDELNNYKIRLNDLMEDDELFLIPDLSLRLLAQYMNLPPNHMSQLLNLGFNQNFSDFINGYRVNAFVDKLKTNGAHQLTLLALAYESGFNSKTVFNTFFKKKMGVTPKVYWSQMSK